MGVARLQLLSGLVAALLVPWILHDFVNVNAGGSSQQNALIGTSIALLAGFWFLRSFVNFPGVRGGSYILPSFFVSYGIVLTTFFFFRLDYSRFQFFSSFSFAIIWYHVQFFMLRRARPAVIGIVPVGEANSLLDIDGIHWRILDLDERGVDACDSVVADLRADMPDAWDRFLADTALAGVPIFHFKQVRESLTGAVAIEHLSENNFGSLVPGFAYLRFKQAVDFIAAAVVGLMLLPFLLMIALVVRLDSPGPALFRQHRVGFRGKPFKVYKFRTMRHIADRLGEEERRQHAITVANDRRITRLGAFLRRTRIDELPQIANILKGQMSWIGPRPEAAVLSQWYEDELPFYRYRHIVRPGITGWAQVNQGHVADVADVLFKLHYDFYYIKYFSPWLDVLIVMRTIRTMFTGFGSR